MKLKFGKRFTAILVALILSASTLVSCGGNNNDSTNNSTTTTKAQAENNAEESNTEKSGNESETEEAKILPNLPEGQRYDDYVFTILSHKEESLDWVDPSPREVVAEEENAEPINDAVYTRNMNLKEKYGFSMNLAINTDEGATLSKAVKAGEDIYDAVMIFGNNTTNVVGSGNLVELKKLPHIDINQPWWDDAVVKNISIANKNFLLAGDMIILDNEATNALIFNKDLWANLGKELPYSLVTQGKWTMDKMLEYVKDAAQDLNGDNKMTPGMDDRWGFVVYNDTLHALLIGGGGFLVSKNADDMPVVTLTEQKNLSILDKAMDIMYDKTFTMNIQADLEAGGDGNPNWQANFKAAFKENRSLLQWIRLREIEKFRDMEANFGILPIPKFDESQDNYRSAVNHYTGILVGVPQTASDLERTSFILEALAAESKYTLTPAYYTTVLQRKYTRDEESTAMLDIIFNTRVYDVGGVYSFGDIWLTFTQLANTNNRNVTSWYEKKQNLVERGITRLVDKIESLE